MPPTPAPAADSAPTAPRLAGGDGRPAAVVHLAAELHPYARTGGLGEAVASLAAHQAARGIPTAVVLPLYRQVRERVPDLVPASAPFTVPVGPRREWARLWTLPDAGGPPAGGPERRRPRPRHYFLENEWYFGRPGIYGEGGGDYGDNARRYAWCCAAAVEALPAIGAALVGADGPLVLHAHDWHAALAPVYLRTRHADAAWARRTAAVLSVHNAGFQGHYGRDVLDDLGLPAWTWDYRALEWYGQANLLKGGLAFSDAALTVSPNHAAELRTPEGGFGLHGTFAALGERFGGVLNGIDQVTWNPAADARIAAPYDAARLDGKRACRQALQRAYGLPERDDVPIFAMAARLAWQKGLDLILAPTGLFDLDAQFVFLGTGERRYEDGLRAWAAWRPDRVRADLAFTDAREHQLIAGADLLLMPCQYEPCGLTQMRAQRYGTLPLVRRVGGLADTVDDGVTGFVFDAYDPGAFVACARRAVATFADRPRWDAMVRAAMGRDFGWARSEARYAAVYARALAGR